MKNRAVSGVLLSFMTWASHATDAFCSGHAKGIIHSEITLKPGTIIKDVSKRASILDNEKAQNFEGTLSGVHVRYLGVDSLREQRRRYFDLCRSKRLISEESEAFCKEYRKNQELYHELVAEIGLRIEEHGLNRLKKPYSQIQSELVRLEYLLDEGNEIESEQTALLLGKKITGSLKQLSNISAFLKGKTLSRHPEFFQARDGRDVRDVAKVLLIVCKQLKYTLEKYQREILSDKPA